MSWAVSFLGEEIVFQHPERMWLFLVLVFLFAVAAWEAVGRQKVWRQPWHYLHRATAHLPSPAKRIGWWFWFLLGMSFLVLIVMTPEKRITERDIIYGRMRITLITDTSLSQFLAEDVAPNRMAANKKLLTRFVTMLWRDSELKGRYEVALIPFAGTAHPVFAPFTTSLEEVLSNIAKIDERTVAKGGTSLWAALKAYDELLLWYPAREEKGEEVTTVDLGVLISDGGKEEGRGKERAQIPRLMRELRDPYRQQEILKNERFIFSGETRKRNVVISTVGVGAVKIANDGKRAAVSAPLVFRDRDGNFRCYYREDESSPLNPGCNSSGPILTSTLDEEILKSIAELGGGKYYHFFENQDDLLYEFKSMILRSRKKIGQEPRNRYEPAVHLFALPAFLIFYLLFGYGGWIRKIFTLTIRLMRNRGRF